MITDEMVLELRSKTALGRLNTAEVRSVLDYLASIGFALPVPAVDEADDSAPVVGEPIEPAAAVIEPPAAEVPAQLAPPPEL
jgi:hypothetical protein